MLLWNHGASALGKVLRRPIIIFMTSFDGTAALASGAMRSTMALFRNGRSISSTTPRSSPATSQRTWHPNFGIVFGSSTPKPRPLSTAIAADLEQDTLLHSSIENSYAGARSDLIAAHSSTVAVSKKVADDAAVAGNSEDDPTLAYPEQNELPRSTIAYKMSEELFRAAKNAEPESAESYWSHTLYRGPEVDGVEPPKVKVHYCKSKHTTERVCKEYFQDKKLLGFDIEWKPDTNSRSGAKKNVSLIQIACEERIALFHIALYPGNKTEDLVAPTLKKIMEDPSITKTGVAIKGDCTRLRKYLDIHSKGLFELSHLYKLVKYSTSKEVKLINKRLVSLALQVQEHLHLPLFKGDVRGSDWSLPLQMDQIIYAASDSYAGIHLYNTLEIKRKALDPTPPRPFHAEEDKPIQIAEGIEIPTDEELDAEDPEPPVSTKRKYTKVSAAYLATASENIELDPDFEITDSTSPRPATVTTRSKSTTPKPAPPPKDPRVESAGSQADEYRATHHQNRATPSSLRCYFLWYHNQDLSIEQVAALLRETPLQTSTVVNYILDAVKLEKLRFENERLRNVLSLIPKEVVQGRYRVLAKACGEEFNKN